MFLAVQKRLVKAAVNILTWVLLPEMDVKNVIVVKVKVKLFALRKEGFFMRKNGINNTMRR